MREWTATESGDCIDNTEVAGIYRRARCGLNLYRREAEEAHTGEGWAIGPREIEMAACRLFFLRDSRPESDEIFHMLPTFDNPIDASEKLRWWLEHDRAREKAAMQAREAIADRTFDANARQLLKMLDDL